MSYAKMMKWNRKHPKGTRQTVIMHTDRGFTPSKAYLDKYFEYRQRCEDLVQTPADCEFYYYNSSECEGKLTKLKMQII